MSAFEKDLKHTVSGVESEKSSITSASKNGRALGNSVSLSCSDTEVLNGEEKDGDIKNSSKMCTQNLDILFLEAKKSIEKNNYAVPSNAPNLNDLCGMESVKSELEILLMYPKQFPELYKDAGVELPRTFLFYGVTGTGKTSIAQAIAKEMAVSCYIEITPCDILSRYIGVGEKQLSEKFKWANNHSPSAIFIDDIDFFATTSDSWGLKARLLEEMKAMNPGVILMAASSYPHHLDRAIVRGFDKRFYIGLPDFQQRVDIFKKNLRCVKNLTAENFVLFASHTVDGFTSADIERICTLAKNSAICRSWRELDEKKSNICKDCEPVTTKDDVLYAIPVSGFFDKEDLIEIEKFARARGDILVKPRPQFELAERCSFCQFVAFICCWDE